MKTVTEKLYEVMFLVDSGLAARDWEGVNKVIKNILKKAKAEVVSFKKWDERKLAYEISGQTRGTYILCYFKADGQKIQDIERNVQLSEKIMRVLILNAEHMTTEDIEKETPATQAEKRAQQFAEKAAEAKKKTQKKAEKKAEDKEPVDKPIDVEKTEEKKEKPQASEPKQPAATEEKQKEDSEEKTQVTEPAVKETSESVQTEEAKVEDAETVEKDKEKK